MMALTTLLPTQIAFGQTGGLQEFRDRVVEIMRAKFPDVPTRSGADDGSISIESSTVNLANIYATARQLPANEQEAAIIDFLSRVVESYHRSRGGKVLTWDEAKELLRPRLVSAEYLRPAPDVLRRAFAPGVFVVYAVDYGRQVGFADRKGLEQWQVDLDQVHDVAVTNLEALSKGILIDVRTTPGSRFAAIATGDSYDAARLALPQVRARLLSALDDPIFVGIPNRDFLVAWPAGSPQFATFVAQISKDFRQQPYAITDIIFHVDREGVRPASAAELSGR